MKNTITLFLASLLCASGITFTNVDIIPPSDSLPVAFDKINKNFDSISNNWNTAGGSGNLSATNLTVTNRITLVGLHVQGPWIELTNVTISLPCSDTNGPYYSYPTNTGLIGFTNECGYFISTNLLVTNGMTCTNFQGPYWNYSTNAFTNACGFLLYGTNITTELFCTNFNGPYLEWTNNIFTNACGFRIYYNDPTPGTNVYTNQIVTEQLLNITNMTDLYEIDANGTTYTFTNGAFWAGGASIKLRTAGNQWFTKGGACGTTFGNSNLYLSACGPITALSTNTQYGFNSANAVPQYGFYVYAAVSNNVRVPNAEGLYHVYGSDYWTSSDNIQWIFTNALGWKASLFQWTDTSPYRIDTPSGVVSITDGVIPSYYIDAVKVPNPAGITNQITFVSSVNDGVSSSSDQSENPPVLRWYDASDNCFYLVNAPYYWSTVNEANRSTYPDVKSALQLDEKTGAAQLVMFGQVVKVIPQSDTTEWQPCE